MTSRKSSEDRPKRRAPIVVALVSLALTSAFVVRNLVAFDGDPTVFITIGENSGTARDYAEARLGPDIHLVPALGHDGRFFFAQANDPFLTDPDTHAVVLDRPTYRYQRMLFPSIAGVGGLLPPWGIVWGILALSVLTFAGGTFAAALVSQGMGGSPWWGLSFGLNVGVLSELLVGGSGHLAVALLLGAVAALQRGRTGLSVGLLTASVLTREVILLAAAGLAVWLWRKTHHQLAVLHLTVPALFAGGWAVYVRSRLGWTVGVGEVEEIGRPFHGIVAAADRWTDDPQSLVVGVVALMILVLFTFRFIRSDWMIGYAVIGFVPLALLLTRQVWLDYFNISRAISPLITGYLLLAFAARGQSGERVQGRLSA